jgi:hypothetical protein
MRCKYKKCQSYAAGTPQRLRNWSVASAAFAQLVGRIR